MKKSSIILGPGEIFGMEHHSGYVRYYVFGTNPADMFKRVVQMYNSHAGTKYNKKQFIDICKEDGHVCFLYRFNIGETFSFDDDCYSMGELGGKVVEGWKPY